MIKFDYIKIVQKKRGEKMEGKKPIKISLSTFFLILAIIVIIVMGMFIYKLNKDKTAEIQKSAQLKEQVNNLNGTVSELQNKINNISETIKDNDSTENSVSSEADNISNVQKNDKDSNKTPSTTVQEKEYDNIVLDGKYVIPNSDIGWDFTKDGKAASSGNFHIYQGTYKTTGKNTIEIHYTKSKIWDEVTNEITISNIDTYDNVYIDENNNIYLIDSNKKHIKLERFGEAVIENLE